MGLPRSQTDPGSARPARVLAGIALLTSFAGAGLRILADCASYGLPFTDLGSESTFCAAIAEAYYTGLTNGTSATTYSPSNGVTRDQMAAFITRTLDQSLLRGSPRAARDRWWAQAPPYAAGLALTSVGSDAEYIRSDGDDVWVATSKGVERVRASDGKHLQTWGILSGTTALVVALGRVFATQTSTGGVWMIDAAAAPGDTNSLLEVVGDGFSGETAIAFDGSRLWMTKGVSGILIATPETFTTWSVTSVTSGFTQPYGILFDGANIWVTDVSADNSTGTLLKLDSNGGIVKTVTVPLRPRHPGFDGHNIWVPSSDASALTVVRASDGTVLKTFSTGNGNANGLDGPWAAAFDGERVLVANRSDGFGGGLSLFRATDLSALGNWTLPANSGPLSVCSDGTNFWVPLFGLNEIGRF